MPKALLEWLEQDIFIPSKSISELLPATKAATQKAANPYNSKPAKETSTEAIVSENANPIAPTPKKRPDRKGFSAALGIAMLNGQEEEALDDTAYMRGKEEVCDPIDVATLMPLLKQYTQTHWEKHPGLLALIRQHAPSYKIDNTLVFSVYNESQSQLIQEKADSLLKFLRIQLNNYQLKLKTTTLAAENKTPKGPKGIYDDMSKKNTYLNDFMEQMGLELEF